MDDLCFTACSLTIPIITNIKSGSPIETKPHRMYESSYFSSWGSLGVLGGGGAVGHLPESGDFQGFISWRLSKQWRPAVFPSGFVGRVGLHDREAAACPV